MEVKLLSLLLLVLSKEINSFSFGDPLKTAFKNEFRFLSNFLRADKIFSDLFEHVAIGEESIEKLFEIVTKSFTSSSDEKSRIKKQNTLNSSELIADYGFNSEVHKVTTEDGYILTLIRVYKDEISDGKVVALFHGFLQSSDDFLTLGESKSIVTKLLNAGHDVWLGNFRGTVYSREHETLDPEENDYWKFSWQEMGTQDIPAMINYILKTSGKCQLTIVSQSQAATATFVTLSEVPEMNTKVNLHISMATPVYIGNLRSRIFQLGGQIWPALQQIFDTLGIYEVLPRGDIKKSSSICGSSMIGSLTCLTVLFHIIGFDYLQIGDNTQVITGHLPAGLSRNQLLHYFQLVRSGEFQYFDHGSSKNVELYGTETPPAFNLTNISSKTFLFHANNDWLSELKDLERLRDDVKSVIDLKIVDFERFNHLDFLYAKDADTLVYETILDLIDDNGTDDKC